jgi:AcrR family transcriptional regulator
MHTPRQARSVETRRRFAQAARDLFMVHRYEDVTTNLISKRAGRAASLLYIYWPDKASIWSEVMGCAPPGDTLDRRADQERARRHEEAVLRLADLLKEVDGGLVEGDLRAAIKGVIALLKSEDSPAVRQLTPVGRKDPGYAQVDGPGQLNGEPIAPDLGRRDALAVEIGARIRARRVQLGLLQSDLSRPLRVSMQQVHRYELGKTPVSSTALVRIAHELRCSPLDLLGSGRD